MGWFRDKCPVCGTSVAKGAGFCDSCRFDFSRAPEGFRKCGHCGATVPAGDSQCHRCGHDVAHQADRQAFFDRWSRSATDFAIRFTLRNPREMRHHGVQVDEGTLGVLYRDGKCVGHLTPGYHVVTSFWDRMPGAGAKGDTLEVVLIDAENADVALVVNVVRDRQGQTFDLPMRLLFRVADAGLFVRTVMKGRGVMDTAGLIDVLGDLLRLAVCDVVARRDLDALILDPGVREQVAREIERDFSGVARERGLELRGARVETPAGASVEAWLAQNIEIAQRSRRYDVERRLDDMGRDHKLESFTKDSEFNDALAQVAHDCGLKEIDRDVERRLRESRREHQIRLVELRDQAEARRLEREAEEEEADHESRLKKKRELTELEIADAAARQGLGHLEKVKRAQQEEKEAEHRRKLEEIKARTGASIEANIATSEAGRAEQLVRLEAVRHPPDLKAVGDLVRAFAPQSHVRYETPGFAPVASGGTAASEDAMFRRVVERSVRSVGVLLAVAAGRDPVVVGTVWVVSGNLLATNAHVGHAAGNLAETGDIALVVAMSDDGSGRVYQVRSIQCHARFGMISGRPDLPPAYDVAVIEVDAPLPPALPVAPGGRLHELVAANLGRGERVAYLGFPGENLAGGGTDPRRPVATMKSGIVTSITDWTQGRPRDFGDALLIQHDLGLAGGASGSPLFDVHGNVIGVVSAGNMHPILRPAEGMAVDDKGQRIGAVLGRAPSGALLNFAQRADLLRDLATC